MIITIMIVYLTAIIIINNNRVSENHSQKLYFHVFVEM